MTVDINSLLSLPQNQRRKIAETLWSSLAPNNTVSKEEQATMLLLEERWQNMQADKSTVLSSEELRNRVDKHRNRIITSQAYTH